MRFSTEGTYLTNDVLGYPVVCSNMTPRGSVIYAAGSIIVNPLMFQELIARDWDERFALVLAYLRSRGEELLAGCERAEGLDKSGNSGV